MATGKSITRKKVAKFIMGPSSRSSTGCLCCRKRRKKCDETYPVCNSCKKRNNKCVWNTNRSELMQKQSYNFLKTTKRVEEEKANEIKKNIGTEYSEIQNDSAIEELAETCNIETNNLENSINQGNNQYKDIIHLSEIELSNNSTDQEKKITYIVRSPKFMMFDGLDESSILFFEYFKSRVATTVSISPLNSNYFLKTFAMLAHSNQSILSALCSWGSLFLNGPGSNSLSLMKKAAVGISNEYSSFKNLEKEDIYIILNFFLIAVGMEICSGDTKNWYMIFEKLKSLISENGGLKELCKMFNDSNDIKFLISNFLFHDIMTSQAYITGSLFDVEEYRELFEERGFLELTNYGLDPLQGCIQPVYLILGEIISSNTFLKKLRNELKHLEMFALTYSYGSYEEEFENYRQKEQEYLEEIHQRTVDLQGKIDNCLPNEYQMSLLFEDSNELDLHMMLFEVYINVCKMSLNMHIQQLPPISPEQQRLYLKTSILIDILRKTKMITSLSTSLLICGVISSTKYDRRQMEKRFEEVTTLHPIGNVKKIWELVKEYWKRNPTGSIHIDWVDICEEKGWYLPMV